MEPDWGCIPPWTLIGQHGCRANIPPATLEVSTLIPWPLGRCALRSGRHERLLVSLLTSASPFLVKNFLTSLPRKLCHLQDSNHSSKYRMAFQRKGTCPPGDMGIFSSLSASFWG